MVIYIDSHLIVVVCIWQYMGDDEQKNKEAVEDA